MEYLSIYETPEGKVDYLLAAFRGWPDAGEGATGAVRYFLKKLAARKMADLDPEEFYDFTQVRPYTSLDKDGVRHLKWPSNELFYHSSTDSSPGLIFFVGTEPSLKWRTYCNAIVDLAMKFGVHTVIHVGALLDAVPHAREVRITGSSSDANLRKTLEELGTRSSNYQGPSGISSALMERCSAKGLAFATLWGHSPHYLQTAPNYKVTYGIVCAVRQLLGLKTNIKELGDAASSFEREIQKVIEKDSQISAYVEKLEQRYDEATAASPEMPNAEEMVKELEEFLKDQRGNGQNDQGNSPL